MPATDSRSRIQIANDLTSIFTAMRMCDMEVPEFDYGTVKVYCPFDEEKAFRVYGATNSAYCFACLRRYTPVTLIAEHRGVSDQEAADLLLEHSGWSPPTPEARWDSIMTEEFDLDRASEGEALKMFCGRVDPQWPTRQFEPAVAARLSQCLALLDKILSADDLALWRERTRIIMKNTLKEGDSSG